MGVPLNSVVFLDDEILGKKKRKSSAPIMNSSTRSIPGPLPTQDPQPTNQFVFNLRRSFSHGRAEEE